ncbi:MAG: hypothetical protein KDA83_12425, partial [Planctomycetales bacterium]|nr:hypothetical protein [Planctomycetales bacterium]
MKSLRCFPRSSPDSKVTRIAFETTRRAASSVFVTVMLLAIVPRALGSDDGEHFERHVRPLLIERCFECHAGPESQGGLQLDSLEGIRKGGDSGPALDRAAPDNSLLLRAVRHEDGLEMPPD